MITDTDVLALGCILLALACAGLAIYAWQEHVQCSVNRIRAEEQATWADHFQTDLDECAAENARLRRLLTQRQRPPATQPPPATPPAAVLALPWHTVHPDQFSRN